MECRVCLEDSIHKLQIFDNDGRQKRIAEVLEKHFWFAPSPNDARSQFVCVECWLKVTDFDEFYEKVRRLHVERKVELEKDMFLNENIAEKMETDKSKFDNSLETDDMYVTVLIDDLSNDFYGEENEEFDSQVKSTTPVGRAETENTKDNLEKKLNELNNTLLKNYIYNDTSEGCGNNSKKAGKLKTYLRKARKNEVPPKTKQNHKKRTENIRSNTEDDEIVRKHISLHCEICNYKAELFTDIVKHFASNHADTRAFINCCSRRFTKRERVVQHAWLHEDPEHFQCPVCKRSFRDNEIKNAHIKAQHPTEEELIFSCDQCQKRFARAYLLKLHKAIHVPIDKREFFCQKCEPPKAFASQNQLNIHNSMSHNRQPNICHVCGKTIRDLQAYKKHVRQHFEESGPRLKCPEPGCDSWLKDKDNLKQHLRRHSNKNETLECDQCKKLCKDRRALTCHKRSVHPAVLLSCDVCSKLFKKAISLKEHMATHTGETLYECPFCTQKFKSNANMHAHKKKMHPAEWEICKNLKNL